MNMFFFQTNNERLRFMEVSMRALLELRAQLASGALPQDQLRRVARTAVFTIDKGNRYVLTQGRGYPTAKKEVCQRNVFEIHMSVILTHYYLIIKLIWNSINISWTHIIYFLSLLDIPHKPIQ